jgi:pyridoxine 5-phosphate synthase
MRLSVNIDHFATLREARGGIEPDPVTAAHICELHGADGIVCHLREDRRHVNDRDLRLLRETVKTKLDLEMSINDEIMEICMQTIPDLATFVPEKRQELTTEGGLDVVKEKSKVKRAVEMLHARDIEVSLFIDPDEDQVDAAADVDADIVEIHTGEFANARSQEEMYNQIDRIRAAAMQASALDLGVHAGHGLDYLNLHYLMTIPEIEEVSIGHSLVSRAVFVGLPKAVEDFISLIR